jgi:hypothetical protein
VERKLKKNFWLQRPILPLPPMFLQKSAIAADSKRLDVFSGSQECAKIANEGV